VVGVDIAQRFVDLARVDAPPGVQFQRMDARQLDFVDEFDAAISLCQGAFGLVGAGPGTDDATTIDPDGAVLASMAAAVRPGGRVAVSAFSSYFMARYLEDHDTFDADRGVNHERTTVRSELGADLEVDLWTSCFTPRELRLMAHDAGLVVDHLWSVTPGRYAADRPDLDQPEFVLVAHRPAV
jgi:SAM-dependent methyltransferase